MLKFKHFLDRPTWAAAAGYNFNYLDCMAFTANCSSNQWDELWQIILCFPNTLVVELPLWLLHLFGNLILVLMWPLVFWIAAFPLWIKCKLMRRKYQFADAMTDIAKNNIEYWIERVDRENHNQ